MKGPGRDGLNAEFYKSDLEILGHDVVATV